LSGCGRAGGFGVIFLPAPGRVAGFATVDRPGGGFLIGMVNSSFIY
jgi:hypothetical protein